MRCPQGQAPNGNHHCVEVLVHSDVLELGFVFLGALGRFTQGQATTGLILAQVSSLLVGLSPLGNLKRRRDF